jgi:uncharacterized protein (TIGR03067 family)
MARNTLLLLITFLLLACSASSGGTLGEPGIARELKAMAGSWEPIFTENNGYKSSEGDLTGTLWTRDADGKWVARRGGKTLVEWAVKNIDPTQNPKTIDIEVTAGAYKGVVYLGIYELDGDTLRICFALPDKPERPTDFSAAKGTVRALSEFKRVKDSAVTVTGRTGR